MKKYILLFSTLFLLTACFNANEEETSEPEATKNLNIQDIAPSSEDEFSGMPSLQEDTSESQAMTMDGEYDIDTTNSTVAWEGSKVGGSHNGTIGIKSASLAIENGEFSQAELTIDMSTINTTDLEGGSKDKLDNNLKGESFFDVENFPESKIFITEVTPAEDQDTYTFTALLTILGISKEITFEGKVMTDGENIALSTDFIIDRNDWGIGKGLKGAALKDEISYDIDLTFTKK